MVRSNARLGHALFALTLASCGGGHSAFAPPTTASAAAASPAPVSLPSGVAAMATLTINIPKAGIGTTGADKRTPKFVSPATASIRVVAANAGTLSSGLAGGVNAQVLGGTAFALTSGSSGCASVTGAYSLSCTISLPFPSSLFGTGTNTTVDLEIETYNVAPSLVSNTPNAVGNAGALLSSGVIPSAQITKNGANTLGVVLGGVPASALASGKSAFSVTATNHASAAQNTLTPILFYDASGNVIVGPYSATVTATVYSNTPDLQFALNGTAQGAGNSVNVSGSADVLDLAFDGKGMLYGNVQFALPSQTQQIPVTVANIPTYDQYDRFDSSGSGLAQALFTNENPAAVTVDTGGSLWFVSNNGPSGKPVLAQIQFSPGGFNVSSCNLTVPGPFSPVIVVDNANTNNAYLFESSQGRASVVSTQNIGGNCTMRTTTPISPMQPVVGAVLDANSNVWTIDQGGQIGEIVPSGSGNGQYTVLNPGNSDQIFTGTVGGPLFQFNNGQTGGAGNLSTQYGFVWADRTNKTLNFFDPGNLNYYREYSGYSAYGTSGYLNAGAGAGAAIFIDTNGLIDLADTSGNIFSLTPVGSLADQITIGNNDGTPQSLIQTETSLYGGANGSAPTVFANGAENNGALYGVVAPNGAYPYQRGLVRYTASGSTFFPYIPNTSDLAGTTIPGGAVVAGDGRVWFLAANGGNTGALYVFPGNGQNSNTTQAKHRKATSIGPTLRAHAPR